MLTHETWPTDKLIPYARNPRKNDAVVERMVSAIKEFGFRIPIVAKSDGTVVDGHLRLKAAHKLGMKELPVVLADELSDAQVKAFRLLANRSVAWAEWDADMLKLELEELAALDFPLELTGFDDGEFDFLSGGAEGQCDPDDVPEAPEEPVSKAGDIWVLGKHRLMCGDCTVDTDVERVLAGVSPHLMVTDPPYGVEYDASWRNQYQEAIGEKPTYKRSTGKVANDERADWRDAWALFKGDVAYIWHADIKSPQVAESLICNDFQLRALIIWKKNRHSFGRGHYHNHHEPCWYAVRKSGNGHWQGDRKQTTIWEIDRNFQNETGHSTQKPIECMLRPIQNNSSPGQAVYDPFSGSGTTIIASEMSGRSCYALEINPAYVDIAVLRWQNFTGKQAVHAETGKPFGGA